MKKKILITVLLVSSFFNIVAQKLPYPIIFIHGLNSDDQTWNNMKNSLVNNYNLIYGGRINFCLNQDGINSTANLTNDIQLYTSNTFTTGDFYVINFDINNLGTLYPTGTADVLSNEAAITKQGFALKKAIQLVLAQTIRDKVILFGHSMGGLCAREYLQNPSNWQLDGLHHVAKLITTGTPHQGSNAIGGQVVGVNLLSDAMRDLKNTYDNSSANSVYLFGGNELNSVMNDGASNYYNIDVNCDGISNGGFVTGLNNKAIYTNLDYSCIIGTGAFGIGDIAVNTTSANINSVYPNLTTNIFTTAVLHNFLPDQLYPSMKGLDEPNEYNIAYGINYDIAYYGFITEQNPQSPYPTVDYDDYKFNVSNNSQIQLVVNNALPFPIYARIINSSFTQVGSTLTINSGNQFLNLNLTSGQYYLEIYGTPNTSSYEIPYAFGLTSTLNNEDFITNNYFSIYPNPTTSKVNIKSNSKFNEFEIYNVLGQKVLFSKVIENQEIDISSLNSGTYFLTLKNEELTKTTKVIKQ
jgi:triacylglycerol esterase/lipase EstA (alpha/beta hydrolase family)